MKCFFIIIIKYMLQTIGNDGGIIAGAADRQYNKFVPPYSGYNVRLAEVVLQKAPYGY